VDQPRTGRAGKVVPDYPALMQPLLECSAHGEVQIGDVVDKLADRFELTDGG